ncbi:MAG: hypothetical protein ACI4M6_03610 [Christensenellaceae bacterium]
MAQSDYQDMIEIPVSTCEMVVLPKKKKRKNVKKKVIDKVNKKVVKEKAAKQKAVKENVQPVADFVENAAENDYKIEQFEGLQNETVNVKEKKGIKFDIVSLQVVAVFVLIVGILLTNIFWENSGINRLISSVFNKETVAEKNYSDFKLNAPKYGTVNLNGGVIEISGEGAIYSPCEGVVSKVVKDGEKYTLTINHSDSFYSEFKNLDFCYFNEGESVFKEVPVAYAFEGCEMRMYSNNALLTNFVVSDGSIIWES